MKFKDPDKLEFEFTITPTIINPLEITGIPKIIYKLDQHNTIKIVGINLLNSYTDIVPNYTLDTEWPRDWSNMKSQFLDRLQHESTEYKTLSEHMEQSITNPRPSFKPWEEFYEATDTKTLKHGVPDFTIGKSTGLLRTSKMPMTPDDMVKYARSLSHLPTPRIMIKHGLDMSVEERLGKVLGTWFTKTHKITDNIIFMIASLLYTKGAVKDGFDSLITITSHMFSYLINKDISKETKHNILINYARCIIYAMRYNLGIGCKKYQVENIMMEFYDPNDGYYYEYQPRIFVTNEYLLTDNMISEQHRAEILVLTMMFSEMYSDISNSSIHQRLRELLEKIERKIVDKCVKLNDQQDNDSELLHRSEVY